MNKIYSVSEISKSLKSLIENNFSAKEIAEYSDLSYKEVLNYCLRWEKKKLIKKI